MKEASIVFAAVAAIAGLLAAWYWSRASGVPLDLGWGLPGTGSRIEPVDRELKQLDFQAATATAMQNSGHLNKLASLWTAASVFGSGVASIFGTLAS